MNLYYYTLSVVDLLLSKGGNWATHVIDEPSNAYDEFKGFKILFFDIDDTLNAHGAGLSEQVCQELNNYAEHHDVVLLTNCSQKRADQHVANIKKYACRAQLWQVGIKPNYTWLKQRVLEQGWRLETCAMFGDRPTMDLWCAYKAGFGGRFWVQAWAKKNSSRSITERIKKWEWSKMAKVNHG